MLPFNLFQILSNTGTLSFSISLSLINYDDTFNKVFFERYQFNIYQTTMIFNFSVAFFIKNQMTNKAHKMVK